MTAKGEQDDLLNIYFTMIHILFFLLKGVGLGASMHLLASQYAALFVFTSGTISEDFSSIDFMM